MKYFWRIPILAVYIYAVTILAQYGFDSYFGIPEDFIQPSIAANTIFFYSLLKGIPAAFHLLPLWQQVMFWGIVLSVIIASYFFHHVQKAIPWFFAFLAIIFLWNSFNFGELIAKSGGSVATVQPSCVTATSTASIYVIPTFYSGEAVLIPIGANNEMLGGFVVRSTDELPCTIQYKTISPIRS